MAKLMERYSSYGSSAINGGWPFYSREEIDLVSSVLESGTINYWTGQSCQQFEEKFADYLGRQGGKSIAVANGTLALELALRAFEFPLGSKIIVPVRSYVATALAVVNVGCIPVFADIDKRSGNISKATLEDAYQDGVMAVIVVHVGGLPCEMTEILAFCQEKKVRLVEDCAQAHGAKYQGQTVGTVGDLGCWSFCQDKIMSTGGEGGMVYTEDLALWDKMRSFKDHGKNFVSIENDANPSVPGYRWIHDVPGSNYRMTSMQAEIGIYQLARLDSWVKLRAAVADEMSGYVADINGVTFPFIDAPHLNAFYRLIFLVDHPKLRGRESRVRFLLACRENGVLISEGSCSLLNQENVFTKFIDSSQDRSFDGGRLFAETAFAVNINHRMTIEQSKAAGEILRSVILKAIA